jgi:hypothetical protein
MKQWRWLCFFVAVLIAVPYLGMIVGCDSGEKVVDEVTGYRPYKQYQKSKKDIGKISEKQAERYKTLADDEDKGDNEHQ